MSDLAFDTARTALSTIAIAPQAIDQHLDTDELSMDELDEADGGLMIPLLFAAGFFGYIGYHHLRYCK
ncbi:hypothetical protein [Methylobacterium sp. sgz302541]|uniref:hypothetical protein n=1 Tax=unclassified Methylobacterium TaxID=2615210 RepID=UPI003D330F67